MLTRTRSSGSPTSPAKPSDKSADRPRRSSRRLVCSECGKHADEKAEGWRAFLTSDEEAATVCPDRAEREFGIP